VTSFRRVTFRFRSFEEDLGIVREFLSQLVNESIYKIRYILSDVAKISVQRKDLRSGLRTLAYFQLVRTRSKVLNDTLVEL
jgi:hypothetical protein